MDDGESKSDDKAAMEVEEAKVAPKLGKKVCNPQCTVWGWSCCWSVYLLRSFSDNWFPVTTGQIAT